MSGISTSGMNPLSPKRKWQTIAVGTVLVMVAYWSMLAGLVAEALDEDEPAVSNAPAFIVFGLALIPFVFILVAFMSEHPRAPGAVVKAMGLSLLVGITVSAVAGDAVSGVVAGVGAGGAVALRPEPADGWRPRAAGVAIATAYTYVLVRTAGPLALISAPVFPLTSLGLADHYVEWKRQRDVAAGSPA